MWRGIDAGKQVNDWEASKAHEWIEKKEGKKRRELAKKVHWLRKPNRIGKVARRGALYRWPKGF